MQLTKLLYHEDSYLNEFQAIVTGVTDSGIVLDQTAFYPGGGGQPNDVGVMRIGGLEYNVSKVSKKDGMIIHEVQGSPPLVGDTVTGLEQTPQAHAYPHIPPHTLWCHLAGL